MSAISRKQRKAKRRQERLRQLKHQQRSLPKDETYDEDADEGPLETWEDEREENPALPSQFTMERFMRAMHLAIKEKDFASPEDLNAYMAKLSPGDIDRITDEAAASDPIAQAQDLAYQAMEAPTPFEAARKAKQALELNPDCVDALTVKAYTAAHSEEEMIDLYRKAVEAGERTLGKELFEDQKGHFWGILETRPYMRARLDLANLLKKDGRLLDAINHYEALLELNPNDNQGVRDLLVGAYLAAGNLEGARRLISKFEKDVSATFAWSRVLERALSKDWTGASKALDEARNANHFVEDYFKGKKPLPRNLPDHYSFGDEREAAVCARFTGEAWARHPDAVKWLQDMG